MRSEHFVILLLVGCVGVLGAMLMDKSASETLPAEDARIQSVQVDPETPRIPNAASLKREEDGHYWARAEVDHVSLKFLVDTGASVVALTWRDAQRLRLKPEELEFKWRIRTANGETFGASVLLESIRIGEVEVENVEAMVMRDGLLDNSLLGISFLEQLYSYEFKGDTMIIRQ